MSNKKRIITTDTFEESGKRKFLATAAVIKSALIILMLLISLPFAGFAGEEFYSVSGSVSFAESGDIYVELITPENSSVESPAGIQIAVNGADQKKGSVKFKFNQVSAGKYAIQAFQDVNGNGKLDFGVAGPKEPWGFYRNVRPLLRGPKFEEMAFEVNRDLFINMAVK